MEHLQTLLDNLQMIANDSPSKAADDIETAIDIITMVRQWVNAYPTKIFLPMSSEDWTNHHKALAEWAARHPGTDMRSGSAAAADCMRYVVTRMGEVMEQLAEQRNG